jgi:pimeloyl-ACP methyl ester carboxylesterase
MSMTWPRPRSHAVRCVARIAAGRGVIETAAVLHFESTGNRDGAPLLLLHGFSGCGKDFAWFTERFGAGFHLVVPDLRGHGRSVNDLDGWTHEQSATDVLELLDHLGISRCRAVGLSAGGNTLLHVATRRPGCVSAMVLVSATTHFPDSAKALMAHFTAESLPESEWVRLRASHAGGEAQIRALLRQGQALADSTDMSFTPATLSGIQARTLIVYGDRDPFYPVSIAVDLYRAIPHAALWVLPGAGHLPIFELPERVAFIDTTLAFFSRER